MQTSRLARYLLLAVGLCIASITSAALAGTPALIPQPATLQMQSGAFAWTADTHVRADGAAARRVARYFIALNARGGGPRIPDATTASASVDFSLDVARALPKEGYVLDVDSTGIRLVASDEAGLFHGAITLWQLLTPLDRSAELQVPALHIEDAPRFGWRGLMLDSARHFQSVDEIKQLLDAMALHKLNVFHWHLTDDQGWRIPIPGYPRLTSIGACRIPAGDGGIDPVTGKPQPYCGFYTREQIGDIVHYASARHITIVPEFDVPGHAQAAVASYPALGSVAGRTQVSSDWGVHSYLFNPDDDTFRFLDAVLTEMIKLFPGRYIHVGGDEAVKQQWVQSPRVQARMRTLGVANETELQGYFVRHMATFLASHGRRLIGWDEILESELPADATVMSWRGTKGGIEAADKGHDVVMSPSSDLYFDYQQTHSADEPPGRPAIIPLEQVYAFEPVPTALKADERAHILGLQANLWTEHMRTFARVQHAIFPRIAAVAETGWSPRSRKDYRDFLSRLPAELQRYRTLGIDYAQTPFAVEIKADAAASDLVKVTMSTPSALGSIHYSVDGSVPTATSATYAAPLQIAMPADVRAAAFVDGRALTPPATQRFDAASLLQRNDEALDMCSRGLMLRLEDDGPLKGPRAIYNVDIFNPCWLWRAAPLDRIASIHLRAGRIPYYFQLSTDERNRKFQPATTRHGELQVRAGCDGALLASVPLPASPDADGFVNLTAMVPDGTKQADACFVFTGDTRPRMWVIDSVKLVPR